jgi:hypothetical protein
MDRARPPAAEPRSRRRRDHRKAVGHRRRGDGNRTRDARGADILRSTQPRRRESADRSAREISDQSAGQRVGTQNHHRVHGSRNAADADPLQGNRAALQTAGAGESAQRDPARQRARHACPQSDDSGSDDPHRHRAAPPRRRTHPLGGAAERAGRSGVRGAELRFPVPPQRCGVEHRLIKHALIQTVASASGRRQQGLGDHARQTRDHHRRARRRRRCRTSRTARQSPAQPRPGRAARSDAAAISICPTTISITSTRARNASARRSS